MREIRRLGARYWPQRQFLAAHPVPRSSSGSSEFLGVQFAEEPEEPRHSEEPARGRRHSEELPVAAVAR
jgi:hypothetical protein